MHGEVDVYERSPKVSVDCMTLRPGDIFAEPISKSKATLVKIQDAIKARQARLPADATCEAVDDGGWYCLDANTDIGLRKS